MLDPLGERRWVVRREDGSAPLALVERFGGGYRLTRWSIVEREQRPLGVFTSAEQAETAWWRHLDRDHGHRSGSTSARARRLGED
ncbi:MULTISPECIES: hypothetical protein [unclassified Frigoribacterium]|uniref:hypothetical protein n=1 Tax=unclassified Frigoribacterium TaxID=2627005 RepID=UPI0006FEE0B1|nr:MULTISPECIES: hypothetical protein [unclassified Frigoribacterium]KQO82928.1 hypothetical protein ASF17_08030 [Frigoribacterium sp. Leaf263]KQR64377.1 hypothetical protein ASF89_07530 [Frigoribacterium sp. Leaf172]